MREAIGQGMDLLHGGGFHYVVTPNPEIVEACRERPEVAEAVNGAALVLPDGIGVIRGAAMLGTPLKERTPGIEFASGLMAEMAKEGLSLYLLGAKPGVAETAAERLSRQYPGLRIAGVHDGYFQEEEPVVQAIADSGADVVFVCLGSPRQELWMRENGAATGARLLCGLGGSLDVFAGTVQRAPKFWCDHGLEWFYRLCREPWRWKRMLKLPLFLLHVRQEKHRRRRNAARQKGSPPEEQPPGDTDPQRIPGTPDAGKIAAPRIPAGQDTKTTVAGTGTPQGADSEAAVSTPETTPTDTVVLPEPAQHTGHPQDSPTAGSRTAASRPKRLAAVRKQTEGFMSDFKNRETTSYDAEEVRLAAEQAERKRRRRKRRLLRIPLYFLIVGILSALAAEGGWLLFSDLCAFNRGERQEATVVIATGDRVEDVADKLYHAGLIKYRLFFRAFAAVAKAEEKIGAGSYQLNTDMDYRALIVGMRNASGNMKSDTVRVTIPEGYTVRDICALLAEKGVAKEEELLDAAANTQFDYSFIDNNSKDISRLEGFLFPDTYDFYKPERPASALNRLLMNFERKLDGWETELAYAETRGYDLKAVIKVASLIEKETDGGDRARIASVIFHRLDGPGDKGGTYGLLQIDAALLYALPEHTGPITKEDLETKSPYNLYINAGLPPTPIANPGAKSIEAALTPESTDYYYYGLAKDGRHRFFTTYNDFAAFLASADYIGN